MALAHDLLRAGFQSPPGVSRQRANGFYAEVAPDGTLQHFGFYRNGEPLGWVLDGDHAVRRNERSPGEDSDREEWLRDMVDTIYREAEAEHVVCAFCGKTNAEVATLIAGPDRYTYICDECVATCARIIEENKS